MSIFAALTLMQLTGISMNIMTLGGLAVAVGRVVDDAIVVLENIYRHRAKGDDRLTAVLTGAREVSGAITASTATTVMVFLPLGFVGGLVSQFFLPFALTVTFALLASLVCALTVVPVLAYFLVDRVKMDVDEDGEPRRSIWIRIYTPIISWALSSRISRWAVVGGSAVLFFAAFALLPSIPTQFINSGGEKILSVSIEPPPGTSSTGVLDRTVAAEQILDANPDVQLIQSTVPGEGDTSTQSLAAAFSGRAANSSSILVRLDPKVDLKATTERLATDLAPVEADGWDIAVSRPAGSGGGINVIVSSSDRPAVGAAARPSSRARGQPDLINVKSDLAQGRRPSRSRSTEQSPGAGLSTAQVAGDLRSVSSRTGRPGSRSTISRRSTCTSGRSGECRLGRGPACVPVGTGDHRRPDRQRRQGGGAGQRDRINEQPASSISAEITSDDTGAVSLAVKAAVDSLTANGTIPANVEVTLAGVTQQQNEAFGGLFASMGVAILLVT